MATPRRFTEKQELQVVRLYVEQELTVLCIAQKLNANALTVSRVLRRHEVEVDYRRKFQVSKRTSAAMAKEYVAGASVAEVMAQFGVGKAVVRRELSLRKVKMHRFGIREGRHHPRWKGGTKTRSGGYAQVLVQYGSPYYSMGYSPNGKPTASRYVLKQRLLVAKRLRRPLRSNEIVTFKDGNRTNFNARNLLLLKGKAGKRPSVPGTRRM